MPNIHFTGDDTLVPDLSQMSNSDRGKLDNLIKLASMAREKMGTEDVFIRQSFDRISQMHRLASANRPVTPKGEVVELTLDHPAPRDSDGHATDAITYWGDYIFAEASRRKVSDNPSR